MSKKERKTDKRLYECDECKTRRMVRFQELNWASKPKCMACGCTRLELVSDVAKDERARMQQVRLYGQTGSLRLSNRLSYNRHRVVR